MALVVVILLLFSKRVGHVKERAMRVFRPAAMKNRGPDLEVLFMLSFKACISLSMCSTSTTPHHGPQIHRVSVQRFRPSSLLLVLLKTQLP